MDHKPSSPNHSTPTELESSSEEVGEQSSNVDMGTGRSYECVFCKRGFTTAQALGGHMNIHRKDRVKTNSKITTTTSTSTTTSSSTSTASGSPPNIKRFNHNPSTLRPTLLPTHHLSIPPQTYLPTSSTWCLGSNTPPHDHQLFVHTNNNNNNSPNPPQAFKENWTNMSLTSPLPPTASHHQHNTSLPNAEDDDDDELDLELRLGHDR